MNWEKYFPLEKMEWTHWEICRYHRMFGQKALKMYMLMIIEHALVNELIRHSSFNIVSLFVFTNIFHFLWTLLTTVILDERYMCCSIKIQKNNPRKYRFWEMKCYLCQCKWCRWRVFDVCTSHIQACVWRTSVAGMGGMLARVACFLEWCGCHKCVDRLLAWVVWLVYKRGWHVNVGYVVGVPARETWMVCQRG